MSHRTSSQVRAPLAGINFADVPTLRRWIAVLWREFRKNDYGQYRPERHYMRGPGPKWRERYGKSETTGS